MNRKQKVAVGIGVVWFLALVLFPPWIEVLRDDPQELHLIFLGPAPIWDPPSPTRDLEKAVPNLVKRDSDRIYTWMLHVGIALGAALWLLRTRRQRPRVGGRRRRVEGQGVRATHPTSPS